MHILIFRATLLLLILVLLPLCMCVCLSRSRNPDDGLDGWLIGYLNGVSPLFLLYPRLTGETDISRSVPVPDQNGTGTFVPVL